MKTGKKLFVTLLICSAASSFLIAKTRLNAKKHSPLAVMTILSNSTINWEGEDADQTISSANSTVQFFPVIEESLKNSLTSFGFSLIDKKDITSSSEYKNAPESNYYKSQGFVTPENYKLIPEKNKIAILIKEKTHAKAFAYINVFLEKKMSQGYNKNGTMECKVTVYIDITNENGKLISSAKASAVSEKNIQVVDGNYNQGQLSALFPKTIKAAITNAIAALG